MDPHIVCVGGEDHKLRVPFLLALRRRGYRVTAVSTGDGAAFDAAGIAHESYRFNRFSSGGSDWGAIRAFGKQIAGLKADIVQSFDTKPNLLVPLATRGNTAVVRTINGLGWVFSSTEPRALAIRPAFCALQWLAARWTSATVFQNREDQAFFSKWHLLGSSKSQLIGSSGVDSDAFVAAQKSGPSRDRLRAQLGLTGAEIIIYVGRLTRQKGIPTLLKALPKILAARPSARLVLVGPLESEGPFAIDPQSISGLSPHVMALGQRSDVSSLLAIADVFAFPTEYREGIPRVLLEAGLSGLPIVASRMPGCSDVVTDGRNGYLVEPRKPDAFAEKIIALLGNPEEARAMGARSVPLVRQRFDLAKVTDAYCGLYNSILEANRGTQRGMDSTPLSRRVLADPGSLPQ